MGKVEEESKLVMDKVGEVNKVDDMVLSLALARENLRCQASAL